MATQIERLDMRLSPEHKKLIEQAALLKGQSLSAWMKFVLLNKAQEVLDAHSRTTLSRKDCEIFLEIADSDDEPSSALSEAGERYRKNRVER